LEHGKKHANGSNQNEKSCSHWFLFFYGEFASAQTASCSWQLQTLLMEREETMRITPEFPF
jgi:hypothetical protein